MVSVISQDRIIEHALAAQQLASQLEELRLHTLGWKDMVDIFEGWKSHGLPQLPRKDP